MEFTKAFLSVFSSCTVASITEVGAKRKKPRGSSTGKIQKPSRFRNKEGEQGRNQADNKEGPGPANFIADGSGKKGSDGTGQLNYSQGQVGEVKGVAL